MYKFLLWNIGKSALEGASEKAEAILAHTPDTVVLTEITDREGTHCIKNIFEKAGLSYCIESYKAPKLGKRGILALEGGVGVYSKYPLQKVCTHETIISTQIGRVQLIAGYWPQNTNKEPYWLWLIGYIKNVQKNCLLLGDLNTGNNNIDRTGGAKFYFDEHFDQLGDTRHTGWVDVWRAKHESIREYSYYSKKSQKNGGGIANGFRIDHAFATIDLLQNINRCEYSHSEREKGYSTHSILLLDYDE